MRLLADSELNLVAGGQSLGEVLQVGTGPQGTPVASVSIDTDGSGYQTVMSNQPVQTPMCMLSTYASAEIQASVAAEDIGAVTETVADTPALEQVVVTGIQLTTEQLVESTVESWFNDIMGAIGCGSS